MVAHAGRRYNDVVDASARSATRSPHTGSRRMDSTVYLEDLRCDGSAHGGCQAGCKLYWKDAWLRRVDASPLRAPTPGRRQAGAELERGSRRGQRRAYRS